MVIDAGGSWAGDNKDTELSRARNLMNISKFRPKIPYQGRLKTLVELETLPGNGYRMVESDLEHGKRITYLTNTGIIMAEKAE